MLVLMGKNFIFAFNGHYQNSILAFSYSRRILWLKAGVSNNNPRMIAKYFLDYVYSVKGTCTWKLVYTLLLLNRGSKNFAY